MKLTNLIRINNGKSVSRLLFITALSSISLFSYAQHQQVRLTGSNVTLKTAFKQIEQQTKLFVDYNMQEVNDSRVLTKLPKNSNVKEVMEQLLEGSGCSITFSNGHIIINKQARTVSSTKNISGVVKDDLSRIILHRNEVVLRLALYCLLDIRLRISHLYSCNLANSKDSLSIPTASDVIFNATISRSENQGTIPLLGTFPDSLTKLPATCLHMFRNFANIAYRLCIRYLFIKSLVAFNLLNIDSMYNFYL